MMPSTRQVEYCLVFVDRLLQGIDLRRWGELRGPRPQCKVEALGNCLINAEKNVLPDFQICRSTMSSCFKMFLRR